MNVLLDTNILTRWVNPQDAQHDLAAESLRRLRRNGHVPTLVPQNLYEFWVVATRPTAANGLGMSTDLAESHLHNLTSPLFAFLQDERAIFGRWKDLVTQFDVKGKPAHDARFVAAMLRHGITHLLTFNDADYKRFPTIFCAISDDLLCDSRRTCVWKIVSLKPTARLGHPHFSLRFLCECDSRLVRNQSFIMEVTMNTEIETVYEDQRGRMKLKIIRKNGKYGPRFSAMVYRPYKKEDGDDGKPVWAETHWLDEQDVLNSLRLHEVADDMIAEAKRQVSASKEAA